jgi:multidrug efflux pump subunit AcrA (membrane-fusion protein)
MSAVGLPTAAFIESPQQVAARSAAPPTTPITTAVRWQVLRNTITVQGLVRSARRIEVAASAPFPTVTVTRLPVKPGSQVRAGQLLAEIDGRPIFVLRGRLPPYRDLRKGDHGPDVTQLQRALEGLGYANFDPPGEFGQSTAFSLLLFYRHLGYTAPVLRAPDRSRGTSGGAGGLAGDGGGIPNVYLPMSEVVFIPGKSALVLSVGVRVGRQPGAAPVVTLATGRPYVSGRLTAHQAAQARKGVPATITAANPPLTARGTVTSISRVPATGGAQGYPVRVRSARPLPQRLIGAQVRLTLKAAVTAEPVLTVPVAAIMAAGHGRPTRVLKVTAAGQHVSVAVFTGPTADGLVAVQPVHPASLRPGDRVLVGFR